MRFFSSHVYSQFIVLRLYTYLCSSKVGSISKGTESLAYAYDGSLLTSESKSGTLNQTLEFAYNNDFNLSAITYAGGTENLSYDDDGLLISVGAYSVSRNAANGLPEQVSGNALNRSRSFNGYGELTAENAAVNSLPVSGWSVTRNKNGRILSKTETVNGSAVAYAYTYDAMGRLLTVRKDGSLVEEYQYGLNGSRTYEKNTLKGESGRTYSYSVEDHLLSAGGVSYEFNADGFLTKKTQGGDVTNCTYSSRGELLHVTLPDGKSIEYLHDPLGRRIAKKVNGSIVEKYLWRGLTQLLAVYDGSDKLLMRFEYADGRMPVAMTAGGASYYLGYDQVGSLRTVADASGSVVKAVSYDSFGTIVSDSNPALAVPFGFAGGLHDRETGLVKFGFRDYDPAIGRWVAKDPIFFAGGDVDLYGYVLGDPIGLVDPVGLAGSECGGCGDETTDWIVPDLYPKSCQRHDECYGTPGASRPACDYEFLVNMLFENDFEKRGPIALLGPAIYFGAVRTSGQEPFNRAQGISPKPEPTLTQVRRNDERARRAYRNVQNFGDIAVAQ